MRGHGVEGTVWSPNCYHYFSLHNVFTLRLIQVLSEVVQQAGLVDTHETKMLGGEEVGG